MTCLFYALHKGKKKANKQSAASETRRQCRNRNKLNLQMALSWQVKKNVLECKTATNQLHPWYALGKTQAPS